MASQSSFVDLARKSGVEITQEGDRFIWGGPVAGKRKPNGPLAGKTIGIPVASEFSDFQAFYLVLYLSEMGAKVEFLAADWIKWKHTRPTLSTKGVQGMWGLSLNPIPTIPPQRYSYRPFEEAKPAEYDGLVVLGEHSADLLMREKRVQEFLTTAIEGGAYIGAIGGGSLPLISSGLLEGKQCTGNTAVRFMLEKIGQYTDEPVVRDGKLITARETVDTPSFVRELARAFDPEFVYERQGLLSGKHILIIAGEDFEDVELVVPVMEFLYRGAQVTIATFPPPVRARPPLLGLDVVMGNFGVSVPLQEIPENYYGLKKLYEVNPEEIDLVMIPGAFCPWNIVEAKEPVQWLKKAWQAGKIIAPICHGAIAAAAADLVKGKKAAGCGQVKTAVTIMGGSYDESWSAVIDGKLVTGRVPTDVPEFVDAITWALLL